MLEKYRLPFVDRTRKKPVIIKAGTEQRSGNNVMPVAMHVHVSETSTINPQRRRTVQSVQVAHTNRP